jgi:predicted nucleotidyltransferase component of viral defense system
VRVLTTERRELIDALVAEADIGDISAGLLEKDEHLTAALQAVFELRFEHATLVFCGGTSLSKAHGLIERMSEDADIKVVLSAAAANWPTNQLRRYLGDEVRGQVVNALTAIGLVEDETARRSQNDNRYLHSQWTYQRTYDGIAALRPNLQLELTTCSLALPIETASLCTLADKLAGHAGITFSAPIVSISETLAEKVLSFLRRFALNRAGLMQQPWDTALVRHIYDVHCIVSQRPHAIHNAMSAFSALTALDASAFGNQDSTFQDAPQATLVDALRRLSTDQQSRDEYQHVLLPLIYGESRFSYDEALSSFNYTAQQLISVLQAAK